MTATRPRDDADEEPEFRPRLTPRARFRHRLFECLDPVLERRDAVHAVDLIFAALPCQFWSARAARASEQQEQEVRKRVLLKLMAALALPDDEWVELTRRLPITYRGICGVALRLRGGIAVLEVEPFLAPEQRFPIPDEVHEGDQP